MKDKLPTQPEALCFALGALVTMIALKVTGTIVLSWWWVLAPLWAPVAVILLLVIVLFVSVLFTDLD